MVNCKSYRSLVCENKRLTKELVDLRNLEAYGYASMVETSPPFELWPKRLLLTDRLRILRKTKPTATWMSIFYIDLKVAMVKAGIVRPPQFWIHIKRINTKPDIGYILVESTVERELIPRIRAWAKLWFTHHENSLIACGLHVSFNTLSFEPLELSKHQRNELLICAYQCD